MFTLSLIIEFIAGAQTTRALQWRSTSREQLVSIYRHYLVSYFGPFAARLLARRILDRFRARRCLSL
jgi:hypothetical protein